ncbi:hypothetical protein Pla110_11570 [Polystyrenella longa]|uniref:Uncharacterized protein n=1 Tax=Polystyrenella longa TaxID=2528007 RepID=A0A518CJR4_9PLAN|nr:hypothetical protein Pla110_11570 [Polystyrenella longa]
MAAIGPEKPLKIAGYAARTRHGYLECALANSSQQSRCEVRLGFDLADMDSRQTQLARTYVGERKCAQIHLTYLGRLR